MKTNPMKLDFVNIMQELRRFDSTSHITRFPRNPPRWFRMMGVWMMGYPYPLSFHD